MFFSVLLCECQYKWEYIWLTFVWKKELSVQKNKNVLCYHRNLFIDSVDSYCATDNWLTENFTAPPTIASTLWRIFAIWSLRGSIFYFHQSRPTSSHQFYILILSYINILGHWKAEPSMAPSPSVVLQAHAALAVDDKDEVWHILSLIHRNQGLLSQGANEKQPHCIRRHAFMPFDSEWCSGNGEGWNLQSQKDCYIWSCCDEDSTILLCK